MVQYFRLVDLLLVLFLSVGMGSAGSANDSAVSVGAGGLVYERNENIQMLSEDLLITQKMVRVEYSYYNKSDRDIDVLVSFPIEKISNFRHYPDFNPTPSDIYKRLNFRTWVDGEEINWLTISNDPKLEGVQNLIQNLCNRLWFKRNDIYNSTGYCFSSQLGKLMFDNTDCRTKDPNLSIEQDVIVKNLIRQEKELNCAVPTQIDIFFPKSYENASDDYINIARYQTFPSKSVVKVVHKYQPILGGGWIGISMDTLNERVVEENDVCMDKVHYKKTLSNWSDEYQIDDFGKWGVPVYWTNYILITGQNWNGPIGNFRLEINGLLISTCFEGLKQVSDQSFVFEATDFIPTENINITFYGPPRCESQPCVSSDDQ